VAGSPNAIVKVHVPLVVTLAVPPPTGRQDENVTALVLTTDPDAGIVPVAWNWHLITPSTTTVPVALKPSPTGDTRADADIVQIAAAIIAAAAINAISLRLLNPLDI